MLSLVLKISVLAFTLTGLSACVHKTPQRLLTPENQTIAITTTEPLYQSQTGTVELGGLSDLVLDSAQSTEKNWVFYSMTDRGPNGKPKGPKKSAKRPFLVPDFSPQILKINFDLETQKAQVVERLPITRPDGTPASGLPLARSGNGIQDEVAVDTKNKDLKLDLWGMDPEGLAKDSDGFFWMAEEYGPSLLKVSAQGKILKRWSARDNPSTLPSFLALRKINRGFEAITWTEKGNLLLFLQSELPTQDYKNFAPVVEFDPKTEKTVGLYFYPLSKEGGKIGAATQAHNKEIFVLEQSGDTGTKAWQKVFKIDLAGAHSVLNEDALSKRDWKIPAGTPALVKTEVADLASTLNAYEKLEGMTFDPQGRFVIVNDNDFGVNPENNVKSFLFFIPRKNP